ncbi:MAG: hypothetical protein AAFX87_11385 [Bacteroidota bacterium]
MKSRLSLFLILITSLASLAQTANDDMHSAQHIAIHEEVDTYTDGNTVQWECVDEKITGKCIKYHNDQWFTFNSGDYEKLYINISGQECRDLLGVQLVIIDGEPCQPETYTLLDCVSLATQDDIFVELGSLKPNHRYWLNIDGYLHDFCRFNLVISDKPSGSSAVMVNLLESTFSARSNVVRFGWKLHDSLAHKAANVHVLRRERDAFKFQPLDTVPVSYNAYGIMRPDYQYTDTLLLPGQYFYRLHVEYNDGKTYFVDEFSHKTPSPYYSEDKDKVVTVELDYEQYVPLSVSFFDAETDELLHAMSFKFDYRQHRRLTFYKAKWLDRGIKELVVRVINHRDDHEKSLYVRLTDGKVVTN